MKFRIARSCLYPRSIHLCLALLLCLSPISHGASVTLTASDSGSNSSFNSAGNWSDSQAPNSANDYTISASYTLRTPSTTGDFSFAGNSLTIANNAHLAYKGSLGSNPMNTITISNLIMQNGAYINNYTSNTFTLAGNFNLSSGTAFIQFSASNAGFEIASTISGSGKLTFNAQSSQTSLASMAAIVLSTNSYTGGTSISQYANVEGAATNAFGMGNITINGGYLKLSVADAIDDSAKLIVASGLSGSVLSLTYSGNMILSGISIDGGTTYLATGTYSVSDLNSLYGINIFSGNSAYIQIIPEPSTIATLVCGMCLFLFYLCTSRRFSSLNSAN